MATSSDTSDQVQSKRPAESAFKQQRLPAWQPILTAGTVLPTFFVIGIAFIPVGIGLLYFSDEVRELVYDYTDCKKLGEDVRCADIIKSGGSNCICEETLELKEDFKGDVYFYYGLSNYYQNHRRYVKSRDDEQLLGRLNHQPSTDCEPFSTAMENGELKPVAPCGAIANSLFNDTLKLISMTGAENTEVPVLKTGIAWSSDKQIKFRNPPHTKGQLQEAFKGYTKPVNWNKHVWKLDPEDEENNGFQNEDLIVWMRTAALPTFRKLYRRVNHSAPGFVTGLPKGTYKLVIEYNYPVIDFDGTKSFIISTTSLLGGKNPFLGVAYVVVGTLCLVLGIVLLVIHVRCSKRYHPCEPDTYMPHDEKHYPNEAVSPASAYSHALKHPAKQPQSSHTDQARQPRKLSSSHEQSHPPYNTSTNSKERVHVKSKAEPGTKKDSRSRTVEESGIGLKKISTAPSNKKESSPPKKSELGPVKESPKESSDAEESKGGNPTTKELKTQIMQTPKVSQKKELGPTAKQEPDTSLNQITKQDLEAKEKSTQNRKSEAVSKKEVII